MHRNKRSRSVPHALKMLLSTAVAGAALTGCYMEVSEDNDYPNGSTGRALTQNLPPGADPSAELCSADEIKKSAWPERRFELCFRNQNEKWKASCTSSECQEVPITVSYLLSEDMGHTGVTVEAFNNASFTGAPVGTVHVSNFDTSRRGSYRSTSMFLSPGMYYFRAFVNNEWDRIVPYQYQNLQLVGERPIGIAGGMSLPLPHFVTRDDASLRFYSAASTPVHITIDKLFRKPGQPLNTKAFLRIKFNVDNTSEVPVGRDVLIGLYPDDDIYQAPSAQFKMPTEKLLVVGQVGQADFLTPELEVGKYVVFAWIDQNGNEFPDDNERSSMSMNLGQPKALDISANRTALLEMTLQGPEAPSSTSPSTPDSPSDGQQGEQDTVAQGS
jgi:hypothetical protein